MVDFSKEQLDAFLSKTDFDFSKVEGWKEFLAERREGGTGRDADGIQLRDIKNYAVGAAFVSTTGQPVTAHFKVGTLGSGLALPSGNLFVYHPDGSWTYKVSSFYVGPGTSSVDIYLQVGGGGTPTRPEWGSIYYIVLKSGDIPGKGAATALGKKVLNETIKESAWLARKGFKLLASGEAGYSVSVQVGAGPWVLDYFMPQEVISANGMENIRDTVEGAWNYLK
ncbi:hypothetical protein GOZ89_15485 [Agrobacterium vitis]|uniref:hypothetical protein n=1 Tax=Agrobacterium vitis TaxID=373 RepID=UPI0012E888BC|nr:hypothetical protein [Agrobacterium vitis]MCF1454230.1 hypothetical protein [Agrobacterium vitis]MCF1466580.1 hypothetical protein [Agrobacterium vitis]MVA80827.1 hypothetical protein [Agrobacterium vitis]BCH55122.1 hypothetical protein RvVAR031_27320 [Agrobacterium vitis]